jgi:hypothetical protein
VLGTTDARANGTWDFGTRVGDLTAEDAVRSYQRFGGGITFVPDLVRDLIESESG